MKLKNLQIELQPPYRDNAGKYIATVEFEDGKSNTVKLVLDAGVSESLLGFIGPVITQFSAAAAKQIEVNIIGSLAESKRPEIALT